MDSNMEKLMKTLNLQLGGPSKIDMDILDKSYRELKTELFIKQNQVEKYSKELEKTNLENYELTKDLEKYKKKAEEYEFNLSLMMKKYNGIEVEYQEMKTAYLKLELQFKMAKVEINTLKESNLKISKENVNLSRDIETLSSKNKYVSMNEDEIRSKENKINSIVSELKGFMKMLGDEHEMVKKIGNQAIASKENLLHIQRLLDINKRLMGEKINLENLYIVTKASLEKLESLIKDNSELNKPFLFRDIILKQWDKSQKTYQNTCENLTERLMALAEQLSNERQLNAKLIQEIEQLRGGVKEIEGFNDLDVLNSSSEIF